MPSKYDKMKLTRDQDRRVKATEQETQEMKKLYEKGWTQKAIAEKYKMSQSAVCYIVSNKANKNLAEYRKINPPKRRTRKEAAEYARNLRNYKKEIQNNMEENKSRDCSKCKHAHRIDEITLECNAEEYDIKTLSCFETAEMPQPPKGD